MQVIEAIRASNNDEFFEAMEGGKAICLDTMYVHVYVYNILLPFAPVFMVYMYMYIHLYTCTWICAQPAELVSFLCSW